MMTGRLQQFLNFNTKIEQIRGVNSTFPSHFSIEVQEFWRCGVVAELVERSAKLEQLQSMFQSLHNDYTATVDEGIGVQIQLQRMESELAPLRRVYGAALRDEIAEEVHVSLPVVTEAETAAEQEQRGDAAEQEQRGDAAEQEQRGDAVPDAHGAAAVAEEGEPPIAAYFILNGCFFATFSPKTGGF